MSVNARLAATKDLVQVLRKLPDDSHKIYPSFKAAQLAIYETTSPTNLPNETTLRLRIGAMNAIEANANLRKFPVGKRMLQPSGQPRYYQMIEREANKGSKRASMFTVIKETAFGWWK